MLLFIALDQQGEQFDGLHLGRRRARSEVSR